MQRGGGVLAIDTSGPFCSVAVRGTDGSIVHEHSPGDGDHFERLSSLVASVCERAGTSPAQLSSIRVGTGPGSFTGLRIGMSFAKGLSCTGKIHLVGMSTFLGTAQHYTLGLDPHGCSEFAVVSDARRGELFVARYRFAKGQLTEVVAPSIAPCDEVEEWSRQDGRLVVTPGRAFPFRGVAVSEVTEIAVGILEVTVAEGAFGVAATAALEPEYVRAVSAKSIEERRKG